LYKIWLYLIEYADKIPTAAYLGRFAPAPRQNRGL